VFGILRPWQPELKVREAEYYRAAYCGVCRAMKLEFGDLPRFALRYEAATLAILWMSLTDEKAKVEQRVCAARPVKPHSVLADAPALLHAGRICLILAEAKIEDEIRDGERALPMKAAKKLLSGATRKAKSAVKPETLEALATAQRDLLALEAEQSDIWDAAADTSGRMLRAAFLDYDALPERQREPLAWMGYHLGRWLYLADALLDEDEDARKGAYNPILLSPLGREEARRRVREGADFSAAQAAAAYDLMDWHEGSGIIANLIFCGLPAALDNRKAKA